MDCSRSLLRVLFANEINQKRRQTDALTHTERGWTGWHQPTIRTAPTTRGTQAHVLAPPLHPPQVLQ